MRRQKHIREVEEDEGNREIDQTESWRDEGKEGESRGRFVWRKKREDRRQQRTKLFFKTKTGMSNEVVQRL